MDMNNAFAIITEKFEKAILSEGFKKETVAESDTELTALYIGDIAYSIVYTYLTRRVVLRSCVVNDGEPDNKWKTLATWLFDPETDGNREAEGIGNDFAETVRGPKQTAAVQKQKKRKKDGEANVDPLFLANRMVTYFPELKDEIAYEMAHYEQFRGVTFAEEKIVPRFKVLVEKANQTRMEKLSAGLAAMYASGDLDTKGIITYDLLNSIESKEKFEQLTASFSDADKKVAIAARKLKGKKIRPEKPQKARNYTADALE